MVRKISTSNIPIWQLLLVGLFFLLTIVLIGYRIHDRYQQQNYLTYFIETDKIKNKANIELRRLNQDFSQFKGDPSSASKVKPKFQEGETTLEETLTELKRIDPPQKAKSYHNALVKLYSRSLLFCSELYKVANFVESRGKVLQEFASSVESFDATLKSAKTNNEVINASKVLKSDTDDTLKKVKQIGRPAILVYSNSTLEKYLSELSLALGELSQGIESRDVSEVKIAASKIKALFDQDWTKVLLEEDKEGMSEYRALTKELEALQQLVTYQRNRIEL